MAKHLFGSKCITQIGLVVRDVEKSARKYAELFGMEMPRIIVTAPQEEAHTQYRGASTPARARLAFFDMGSLSLELIEPLDRPSTWSDFLEEKGEGVHHLAFQIEGTGRVSAELAAQNIPVVQQGDYTGGRYTYVDSREALGVVVELLENFENRTVDVEGMG